MTALEDEVGYRLKEMCEPLGFELGPRLPYGRSDSAWWFFRKGSQFRTEAVCFRLRRRPNTRLVVTFFGSPHQVEFLETEGIEGNAGGKGLFDFQFYNAEKRPEEILAAEIPLGDEKERVLVFKRLASELNSVQPELWDVLWADCLRERPDWGAWSQPGV